MATIRDVAKLAGVSVATVSRVLNNQGYVHEDTRKKVEQAIRQLNYKPNAVARSLYKKTSKSIGLIIPDITNPFFPQLVRAVEETMYEAGYTVLLFNSDEVLKREQHIIDLMVTKYVDGIIIVSNTIKYEHLKDLSIPIVALDRVISQEIPSVSVDNYEGARKAVRLLIGKGCKKIAHLRGPKNVFTAEERLRGYMDEMNSQGMETFVYAGNYELNTSMVETMKLLTENREIDGIFAGNDVMAVGAIKAITKLGIHIPDQLKIIGFDGIELGTVITPELSTLKQPIVQLGKKSSELLLNYINGNEKVLRHYVYQAELIERDST
ncbi:LacI family DNA-binding transcriptional regulator [Fervidibacillus halotolerans]|uniref:Catabolite control protein A n=1 Tax=Fervidibacillus halotolerans TaxID=2980027 RepID=A0A9E8RYU5_9BACI|nr:LacI family DNA-binding transcriptional regulator [Fervidibacillus halotolerans]WAA12539.1 LacI family transcriptional regulator [Fervidibacillus halotolerans]